MLCVIYINLLSSPSLESCSALFPVSFRTCLYVLGLISKTKQGCEVLKVQGWDAVRHSRRQQWPVVPDEVEQQPPPPPTLLSSVPSTLSLTSDSTSSRHNSESDSNQPSKCFSNCFLTIKHTFNHCNLLNIIFDIYLIVAQVSFPNKNNNYINMVASSVYVR